jgi:putative molybdopterin biosynthesis protein
VVIVPTGDEIRPVGTDLAPGEIADTNSLMLAAQASEIGCDARVTAIVGDDPQLIIDALREAAAQADLVILIAGSSAGRDDYTARVVAEAGSLAVHGVAVKPGHPVVLGTVAGAVAKPVLGAPGYPVSAALTFDIFAAPMLASLEGTAPRERPTTTARLARKLASSIGSDDWIRVRLGRVGDDIIATPLPRGAGVLTSLVRADGLLVVPAGLEGHHTGEQVRVQLLRGLTEIGRTIVAIGSHDLVLDVAASALRAADPLVTLASSNVGSLGGLVALRDGLCHIAGSHLLDPDTGEYTLPYVDRLLGDGPDIAVIRLVHRDQGLMVAPGNPLGMAGIEDLDAARTPLRQPPARRRHAGAARSRAQPTWSRRHPHLRLFTRGAHPSRRGRGRGRGPRRHRHGDPCRRSGVRPRLHPVAREPYDLVLRASTVDDELLAPLWALLQTTGFRTQVESLGGYSCAETGQRIR